MYDHTQGARWLGEPLELNLEFLKNNMREILDSIIYYELKKFLIFLILYA